ncbi:MAG: hypothetical protein AB1473_18885 [Thermodesulfobacteriota bacterium]
MNGSDVQPSTNRVGSQERLKSPERGSQRSETDFNSRNHLIMNGQESYPYPAPERRANPGSESGAPVNLDRREDRDVPRPAAAREMGRFQDRVRRGKVKLCTLCGGVMTRSSRMVLSPLAAIVLAVMGFALMTAYGLAINFYQTPWFLKFALPAMYYIGLIFIGVGTLFFFIRERVWRCHNCRELSKR